MSLFVSDSFPFHRTSYIVNQCSYVYIVLKFMTLAWLCTASPRSRYSQITMAAGSSARSTIQTHRAGVGRRAVESGLSPALASPCWVGQGRHTPRNDKQMVAWPFPQPAWGC